MGLRGEIPQKVKSSPFSISKLKLSGQQCMYQGMLKEAIFQYHYQPFLPSLALNFFLSRVCHSSSASDWVSFGVSVLALFFSLELGAGACAVVEEERRCGSSQHSCVWLWGLTASEGGLPSALPPSHLL